MTDCTWLGVPFDVSVHHTSYWKNVLATMYSLIPTVFIIVTGLYGLFTRRLFPLMLAIYGAVVAGVNQIIAAIVAQDRPRASCCPPGKHGMPSGHGDHYATFIVWISWEILTNPRLDRYKMWQRVCFLIFPLILWAPGFPSRVYVNDHSWPQIYAGACLGVFWAILWILFLHFYWRPKGIWKVMNWNCSRKIGLKNDYYPVDEEAAERATAPRLLGNKIAPANTGAAKSNPEDLV